MHAQVVTYRVTGGTEEEIRKGNEGFAAMVSAVPGFRGKAWLVGQGDVRGGIYFWTDRDAYQAFVDGELWAGVLGEESMADLESRDFAIDDQLTMLTQPGITLI